MILLAINIHLPLDTILFHDDLIFVATLEDNLQWSIYNSNAIAMKCNMEISTEKDKHSSLSREKIYK
jgi:hypothetical protein